MPESTMSSNVPAPHAAQLRPEIGQAEGQERMDGEIFAAANALYWNIHQTAEHHRDDQRQRRAGLTCSFASAAADQSLHWTIPACV